MRRARRLGRTVVLRVRFADYSRATRSHTLPGATARTDLVGAAARELLDHTHPLIADRGLTLIGIAVSNLTGEGAEQLELPFDEVVENGHPLPAHRAIDRHALDAVLDDLHSRYGAGAVTSATLLGRDHRPGTPLLPDRPPGRTL